VFDLPCDNEVMQAVQFLRENYLKQDNVLLVKKLKTEIASDPRSYSKNFTYLTKNLFFRAILWRGRLHCSHYEMRCRNRITHTV